ncbi:MAG: DUF5908 family protein [Longimicrobiaceae bacterium]
MPLEISEIGIHVRVPDGKPAPAAPAAARGDGGPCDDVEHARLVDDCVRRVLQILAARAER